MGIEYKIIPKSYSISVSNIKKEYQENILINIQALLRDKKWDIQLDNNKLILNINKKEDLESWNDFECWLEDDSSLSILFNGMNKNDLDIFIGVVCTVILSSGIDFEVIEN